MAMASVGGMIGLVLFLFFILVPIGLLIAIQVWLCRKSTKLGLILPGITLTISLILTLVLVLNMVDAGPRILIAVALVFLVTNIPTLVLGGIWLHYKGRRDTMEDLKKMRIEDLE